MEETEKKLAVMPLNKPDPILIERIEEVLEMAKKGEIVSFAILTINVQGEWGECCVNPQKDILRLVGAIEALKTRLIANYIDGVLPK